MVAGDDLYASWEAWERERLVKPEDPAQAPVEAPVEEAAAEPAPPREPPQEATEARDEPGGDPEPEDAGRRSAPRVNRIQFARLHGRLGSYRALVMNLSRTGVLVTLVDPDFEVSEEASDLGLIGLRIASHFGESLQVEFLAEKLTVPAEVVRITDGEQDGRWTVYLGCRFLDPLGPEYCELLQIPAEPAGGEEQEPEDAVFQDGAALQAAAEAGAPVVVVPGLAAADLQARKPRKKLSGLIRLKSHGPRVGIEDLLRMTVERNATDLHFKAGSPVRLRVDGRMAAISDGKLTDDEAEGLIRRLLDAEQFQRFEEEGDLDAAYSLEGAARFRINAFRARGQMGMAIRRIPDRVPTVEELGLAPICTVLAEKPRGLVLVTGPTGSGKSTTLASMIDHVNRTRSCHIITMEDPIEYIHTEDKACITQREVGRDTKDFASALRRALRQDPDVILVGEMRDLETISLAVTAAETGHLVFATLHTTSAVLTCDRIVDVFPPGQQRQIRMQLADALQGIICQVLLPRKGRGVVVAQEVLIATNGVRALIREGKAPQISNMMQTGAKDGMQTLEDSLNDLIHQGKITYEVALSKANQPRQIVRDGKPLVR